MPDLGTADTGTTWVAEGFFDADGLIGGECASCTRRHFPTSASCPWCGADAVVERRLSTEGTVWAHTVVNSPPPGYEGPVPYGFGVAELPTDGIQVITLLRASGEAGPETIAVGDPVRFTPIHVGNGVASWGFEVVGS